MLKHMILAAGQKLPGDDRGATAIEYGLLAALAAVGLAGGYAALGDVILDIFDMLVGSVESVTETTADSS